MEEEGKASHKRVAPNENCTAVYLLAIMNWTANDKFRKSLKMRRTYESPQGPSIPSTATQAQQCDGKGYLEEAKSNDMADNRLDEIEFEKLDEVILLNDLKMPP